MLSHFIALLTKHFIIAKRNCCFTICELLAPILAIGLLLLFRGAIEVQSIPKTTQYPIYDFTFNLAGSHNTFDPMSLSAWMNFQQLTAPLSCANTTGSFNYYVDYDAQHSHHAGLVSADYFNDLDQSTTSRTQDAAAFPLLPDPLTCSTDEFFVGTPTDAEVTTISFNQRSFIFDAFNNPDCFGTTTVFGQDEPVELLGLMAIVGNFPADSTAGTAGHFFDTFKAQFVQEVIPNGYRDRIRYFDTINEALADSYGMKGNDVAAEQQCVMIHFSTADPANYDFEQDIRIKQNETPPTFSHKDNFPGQNDNWSEQITSGQASLQTQINNFIINQEVDAASQRPLTYTFTPKTTGAYKNDLLLAFSTLLFFLLGIANCPTVVSICSSLVKDKEFKQREGMSMMGMSALTYYSSYFVQRLIFALIQTFAMTYMMNTNIYVNSSFTTLLLVFLQLNLATMTFSFMLSAIFDSSRNAAIVGTLLYFGSIFFIQIQDFAVQKGWQVILGCFFPVVSIQFSTIGILKLETGGNGLQFSNVSTPISPYTMLDVQIGSYGSIIIHLLLVVYLEQGMPSEYGISYGWLFPFKSEFWRNEVFGQDTKPLDASDEAYSLEDKKSPAFDNYEELGEKQKPLDKEGRLLEVNKLKKIFGSFTAVNEVSLKMQEGEIFALLGHNGAGKTTTISMLTGLLMPNQGSGKFNNVDLFGQMKKIRTTLGVCPQLDVLFDDMTVREHLEMYYTYKDPSKNFLLKGAENYDKKHEVEKWLDKLQLREFEDEVIQHLSGGTKRRLSVAIALIADSKLVLMDEPSSGMDLTSKYKLWDILKEIKKDRVIILTTHYMDEADQLGDRIAIMGEGEIRCCGSNLFLKSRFGGGYKLTVEFDKSITEQQQNFISELSETCSLKVMECSDVRIDVKLSKEDNTNFTNMFAWLESKKEKYNIANQAFGDSNLEDVFLAVSKLNAHHNENNDLAFALEMERVTGVMRWIQHFMALIIKRFRYTTRDFFGVACEILLPIFCVFVGLVLKSISVWTRDQSPISFEPSEFFKPEINGLPTFFPSKIEFYSHDQTGVSTSRINGTTANTILDRVTGTQNNIYRSNVSGTYVAAEQQSQAIMNLDAIDTEMQNILVKTQDTDKEPKFGLTMYETENAQSFLANVNTRYQHLVPMIIDASSNAVQREVSGSNSASIRHRNSPIPSTESERVQQEGGSYFLYSFFTIIGWALVPTAAIVFIVKERESLSKQQQQVSGVDLASQWASNLCFDLSKFILTASAATLILYLGGVDELFQTDLGQFQVLVLSQLTFALASLMLVQATSFLFNSLLRAMVASLTFQMATGIIGQIAQSILSALMNIFPNLEFWEKVVDVGVSLLNPVQANNRIFNELVLVHTVNKFTFTYDAWDQDIIFKYLVQELITAGTCFLIILSVELSTSNILTCFNGANKVDMDVTIGEGDIAVCAKNCNKTYKDMFFNAHTAVKDISFNAENKTCFVILGTNGAGKSTLFKSMTGEVALTSGDVIVGGSSITSEQANAREKIGQCPQDNSIIDLLNAEEHIYFQGRLKYIAPQSLKNAVELLLDMMNLRMNGDNLAGRFSGGNKRKLMVACSLIGGPKAILLDEPSTGMDPEAKRFMWNSIKKFKSDSGVVLTTHSMDEAEALADTLAIMKRGEFKFVGSLTALRQMQSKGLQVDMMLKISNEDLEKTKLEIGLKSEEITYQDMEKMSASFLNNQFTWDELSRFGNGRLLKEQLYDKETQEVSHTQSVNSALFIEYLIVVRQILAIIKELRSHFTDCTLEMENIGHLLRFNIREAEGTDAHILNCGSLFKVLDEKETELMIDYYSIANSKMETILREFIEDDSYNSSNSCNLLLKETRKYTKEQ